MPQQPAQQPAQAGAPPYSAAMPYHANFTTPTAPYAAVVGPPAEGMQFPHPAYAHGFPPPFGYPPPYQPVRQQGPLTAPVESLEGHCAFCEDMLFACQLVTFGECGHRCCSACFAEHTFQTRREPLVCPCGMRVQTITGLKNKEAPTGRSKRKQESAMTSFKLAWRDQEIYENDDEAKQAEAAAAAAAAEAAAADENAPKPKKPVKRHLTAEEKKEREKREALENNTSRVPKIVRGWMLEDRAARVEGAVVVLYHQEKDKDKMSARCIRLFNDGYITKASQENLNKVMLLLSGPNQKNLDEALEARFQDTEDKGDKKSHKKRKPGDEA